MPDTQGVLITVLRLLKLKRISTLSRGYQVKSIIRAIFYILSTKTFSFSTTSIFALLVGKWYHDKQMYFHCKKTKENAEILGSLKEHLDSYSPTFWLPNAFIRTIYFAIHTDLDTTKHYLRKKLDLSDGEQLGIDLYPPTFY